VLPDIDAEDRVLPLAQLRCPLGGCLDWRYLRWQLAGFIDGEPGPPTAEAAHRLGSQSRS
jgi:hypothetical protein